MSDYEKALENLQSHTVLRQLYLGQEVDTPDGRGIIVKLSMPSNGLYLSPEHTEIVVWFSTEKAVQESTRWVRYTYRPNHTQPC